MGDVLVWNGRVAKPTAAKRAGVVAEGPAAMKTADPDPLGGRRLRTSATAVSGGARAADVTRPINHLADGAGRCDL
jgi:hypothetical protein